MRVGNLDWRAGFVNCCPEARAPASATQQSPPRGSEQPLTETRRILESPDHLRGSRKSPRNRIGGKLRWSLPPLQREAFLLHEEGELTLEEIAQVTECGRETAKSRLRYALSRLREWLEDLE